MSRSCWRSFEKVGLATILFSDQSAMIQWKLAEGVGFEPTVGFPTLDFESSALNRTQPPFLEERRKRRRSNVQHPTSNATVFSCFSLSGRQDFLSYEAKKCNNLNLAMSGRLTASCMSTRTATLLLVVDRYSLVLGAAVHDYSQLIPKPQPLPYRHDSTETRNSARFVK